MKRQNHLSKKAELNTLCLSREVLNLFFNHPNHRDLIDLYLFYCYTAIWQGTDQPKATDDYCMKGLQMGKSKFYSTKRTLQTLKLIKPIVKGRTKTKFGEHYIRVLFNPRWSYLGTPLEIHPDGHKNASTGNLHNDGNPPVVSFAVVSDRTINTKGLEKNANEMVSGGHPSHMRRKSFKTNKNSGNMKSDLVCPHGHRYGLDAEEFKECGTCSIWCDCLEVKESK